MTRHRARSWWVSTVLAAVAAGGCCLTSSDRPTLPSVAALNAPDVSPVLAAQNRYQTAAFRPVALAPGDPAAFAPPAPTPVAQKDTFVEQTPLYAEAQDSEPSAQAAPRTALATSVADVFPAPLTSYAAPPMLAAPTVESREIVRTQSPDNYGGYSVAQLPPGSAQAPPAGAAPYGAAPSGAAPGGVNYMPAGYGVNQTPTTVYQPAAAGGMLVQPVFQPPLTPFTPDSPLVVPDEPPLTTIVTTNETQTGRFMLGVGVNSDAGLVGNIVIDEQNFDLFRPSFNWNDWVNGTAFRGGGERFRLELMPGTQVQRYSFNFTEPYLMNMPVSFGVTGFYFERLYTGWTEQRLGGNLSLGYVFPERPDLSLTGSIGAQEVTITNPSVPTPKELTAVLGTTDLYTARVQLAHDTRDSSFLPTQGHFISMAFEQGFGDFSFPMFEVDGRQYFVLGERPDGSGRRVLGLSGKVGVSGSDTPLYEHYFAGGFSSIRGFAFRGASPVQDGIQVGGDFEILTSIEYRFPLTANDIVYGSFFLDTGTVEPDARVNASDVRISPGFELRINVPALGPVPIALGLGIPVHHAPGDQIQNFFFYVGISR